MRYLISLFLVYAISCQPVFATLNEVDKASIFSKNLLSNGGFESGKVKWTASAGTYAVTTTAPMSGLVHATWDAAASANTLLSTAVAIPAGMYGRNGVASCLITTASGTATHTIQAYDGSNILSSVTITSSTTPTRTSTNFILPSSGSISLRLYANADEPSIAIDDCYLGPAEGYNMSSVSQAVVAGESYFLGTTGCNWARTSATIGAFTADASCPGPTVVSSTLGTWATTDVDLPEQTITNLPPGVYEATFLVNQHSSAVSNIAFAINDGTTTCQAVGGSTATTPAGTTVTCTFTYTTAGTRNFEFYAASAASTANLNGDVTSPQQHTRFILKRFPLSSEQAYTPDLQAMSWSGYHDNTCSWARTNAAYGDTATDASCGLTERTNMNFGTVTGANNLPSITFTPKRAGRYFVCANIYGSVSAVATVGYKMWDGTTTIAQLYSPSTAAVSNYASGANLCGIYAASNTSAKTITIQTASASGTVTIAGASLSSAIEWSIFSIDQSLPAPVLVGSVTSSSTGSERIERVRFNWVAGAPTFISSSSGWIDATGDFADTGTGRTTITVPAGFFSAAPSCTCTVSNNSGTSDDTQARKCRFVTVPSTTSIQVMVENGASAAVDEDDAVDLICMGAK